MLRPAPPPSPWRAETLAALDDWQVRGKVALRDADRAESAQFQWQQRKGISELELSGPLVSAPYGCVRTASNSVWSATASAISIPSMPKAASLPAPVGVCR